MLSVQVRRIYKLNVCLKLKTTETNLDFLLFGTKLALWLPHLYCTQLLLKLINNWHCPEQFDVIS